MLNLYESHALTQALSSSPSLAEHRLLGQMCCCVLLAKASMRARSSAQATVITIKAATSNTNIDGICQIILMEVATKAAAQLDSLLNCRKSNSVKQVRPLSTSERVTGLGSFY
jgi:hypothetical protein